MCTLIDKKWRIAKRAIYGFKAVWSDRSSETKTYERTKIDGFKTSGRVLKYLDGKTVRSPSGPGIMLFNTDPRTYGDLRIKVRVPKGAKYRRATLSGSPEVICADRIDVIGAVPSGR